MSVYARSGRDSKEGKRLCALCAQSRQIGRSPNSRVANLAPIVVLITVALLAGGCFGFGSEHGSSRAAISVGGVHSCALLSDGTVKCWGENEYGQLGDGTKANSSTPVEVDDIHDATQISAGAGFIGNHTCALVSGGKVYCWGYNSNGQLGDGTRSDSRTPVEVSSITDAIQVSAGGTYTCALLSGGTIECWGANWAGQLGNGTRTDSLVAVEVSGINDATEVVAGPTHACALLHDGRVECWGSNVYGQLGNGTKTSSSIPVEISGITHASQVSAGLGHTCALLPTGRLECWGYNRSGGLGDGTKTDSSIPVDVAGIGGASQVSASAGGDSNFTCALVKDGKLECWGENSNGQLGDGTKNESAKPVEVRGIAGAVEVSAASAHACALLPNEKLECWGSNYRGQLGNGKTKDSSTPVSVVGFS